MWHLKYFRSTPKCFEQQLYVRQPSNDHSEPTQNNGAEEGQRNPPSSKWVLHVTISQTTGIVGRQAAHSAMSSCRQRLLGYRGNGVSLRQATNDGADRGGSGCPLSWQTQRDTMTWTTASYICRPDPNGCGVSKRGINWSIRAYESEFLAFTILR